MREEQPIIIETTSTTARPRACPPVETSMHRIAAARRLSPAIGLIAALALLAAALLLGTMAVGGQDQAGASWNKSTKHAGASWNKLGSRTGASWN